MNVENPLHVIGSSLNEPIRALEGHCAQCGTEIFEKDSHFHDVEDDQIVCGAFCLAQYMLTKGTIQFVE